MKNKLLLNELDLFEENNDNIRISSEVKNHNINDIAIIGIGAKLPLADNIDEFWENIIKGKDCIREFPDTRKRDIDNFFAHIGQSDENIQYINGAYLDEIDKFDYEFFRLTPIEARLMDPNQRLFLQTAWEAIEDSGYGGKKIIGTNTGVYVGYIGAVEEYKYKQLCSDDSNSFNAASVPGNLSSIIPSRISYLLDLKGPSMIVDTSCSSSLLAVHLACQGIKNGDCDMAIAGGIRLNLVPIVKKEKLGMESSDGKTRSFDDRSDGTGIGEGVIAILLKPLHKALEDKDNIYAVIKGSSINQDGTSIGITAPNVDAQADVIVKAWNEANIDPETISYIETHGTGTKLGDPIEIEGINKAFSRYTDKKQFCAIGSVKANIGHLYQAAGIVGLLKVVLALKNKQIPPLANFCFPNRKINFEQTPVYINDRLTNWECDKLPRRAGVSSFGFSGTNCHVVLEEADRYYDCESLNDCDNFSSQVLTLSAKSEAALMRLVQLHRNYIKKNDRVNLQNICYTANTGRGHYNYRLILKLKDVNDYRNKIEKICQYGLKDSSNFEDIFYGVHRVASSNEEVQKENIITEAEKIYISKTANEKLKEYIVSDYKSESAVDELCRLYVKGADVDWEELYKKLKVKKVSIPVYPFEKSRCWFEYSDELQNVQSNNDLFYSVVWEEDLLEDNEIRAVNGKVIIFKDSKGISKDLSDKLWNLGAEVIEVEYGREFEYVNNYKYVVGINEEDHERLFKTIGIDNLTYIIHLSTINDKVIINGNSELDESLNLGVYSLFYITRALINNGLSKEIKMLLVSEYIDEVTGYEEKIIPHNSAFMGLGKVINAEHRNIKCSCLDVDSYFGIEDLFKELVRDNVPYHIAYREGKRYTQVFDVIDIESINENEIRLKEDGVYVITGGTGGLGLQIALNLASKAKVKIALIGRSALPERHLWRSIIDNDKNSLIAKKLESLIDLESKSAEVEYYSADISNYNATKEVLDELRRKHNRINGVIHCAGVAGKGLIIRKNIYDFKEVLDPKVKGTWNLDKLTEKDSLDFFVMFSSALSLAGEQGQCDYVAANSYLDSFSYYRNKNGKKALTINWVAWKETGMAHENRLEENKFFEFLTIDKAVEAFNKILKKDIPRVLIGELKCNSLIPDQIVNMPLKLSNKVKNMLLADKGVKFAGDTDFTKSKNKVALKGRECHDYSEIEQIIGQVFKDVLGFKEINIYDNFFELGADSILLTKVHEKLDGILPVKLTVADFFAYPSIAQLAKFIAGSEKNSGSMSNNNQKTSEKGKDIAIIGMALNFPMAKSVDEFWNNIKSGKDCIREYPDNRKADALAYVKLLGLEKNMSFAEGGYLDEVDKFDYSFFRLSPKEASYMDPNQRMFLQTVWNAIEDSGYGNGGLSGSKTGVFVGFSKGTFDYDRIISESDPILVSNFIVGNLPSIIPGRIAYLLDLKGPTVTVDTACSSSLVAVHMACQAIKNGECDMAIAGGVKINLLPLQKKGQGGIGIESTDCRARPFDDNSDGTGWGEGVAAVILKPLEKALEDRDNIYAIIKGSAINQDGSSAGITAPNSLAQAEVIVNAWEDAGVDPETITYIEAHGTGTKLGDPVEIDGIQKAFSRFTDKKQFCAIGSVKSNIGHMDTAAGIAGLIKSVLALKNKQIPPSINFNLPNRNIDFTQSPVFVNDKLMDWENGNVPLRCGVSSFGFSGTNCHVVLEEYKSDEIKRNQENSKLNIFTLSAKSENVLSNMVLQFKKFLNANDKVNIEEVCYTLNIGRDHNNFRLAILVDNIEDLVCKLDALVKNGLKEKLDDVYFGSHKVVADNKNLNLFEPNEITEEQKRSYTLEAQRLMQEAEADFKTSRSHLEEICRLYVLGADIDWKAFYKDKELRRISLPAYPFEKKRCWINIDKYQSVNKKSSGIHPLIKELAIESIGQKIYLTELSVDDNWVLQDHRIMEKHVLPGTAYIEIVRAAASSFYRNSCLEIKEIIFVHPIVMERGEVKKVHTIIKSQNDYLEFTIASRINESAIDTDEEWQIHAQGKVYKLNKTVLKRNLEEIKQSCSEHIQEINQNELTKGFIEFGPRWLNYHKLCSSQDMALAELSLPDKFSEDLNSFYIHPALLDMAVNAVSLTLGEKYLPLAYKNFKLYGPTPKRIYSYLVKKYNESDRLNETLSFDITLMNENGEVFAEIEGYSIKRANDFGKMFKLKNCFYKYEWVPQRVKYDEHKLIEGSVLIFKDELGLGEKLAYKLREQGMDVIEVNYGNCFQKINDNSYTVDNSYESYQKLVSEISCRKLVKILHMFTVNNGEDYDEFSSSDRAIEKGIYSLFYMIKGFVNGKLRNDIDIIVLSSFANEITGEEKVIIPHNAALLGLSNAIKNEYFKLNCKRIDVDNEITYEDIIYELYSGDRNEKAAYRKGIKYVPQLNQINMDEIGENKVDFKQQGVYLVTGGTGGIGLEVCKYLSTKSKVNLALINRSNFPDRDQWTKIVDEGKETKQINIIKSIMDIEAQGSKVMIFAVDVSDYNAMKELTDDLRQRYGRINGVIHGAGVAGEGFLYNKDVKKFSEVILPKIHGTRVLFDLTKEDNLDFFIMFSSVASLFDLPGQGDYIAANSFLDSFCSYGKRKGIKTLTINWPAWKETGMAFNTNTNTDTVFKAIHTNHAIDAFEYSLNKDIDRVIIGELDFNFIGLLKEKPIRFSEAIENKIDRLRLERSDDTKAYKSVEINLKGKGEESYSQIEVNLSKIWAEVLGLDEINIYDSFYELGGDSILATRLLQEVEKEYPGILDITDIFSYSSISKMAEYIESKIKSEISSEKEVAAVIESGSDNIEDILQKLANGDISVDEVEGLIK